MKAYLHAFLEKYDYPAEARELLEGAYQRICADARLSKEFHSLLEEYEKDICYSFYEKIELMPGLGIAYGAGIHEYTGYLLLVICMSKTLKHRYQQRGLPEEVWENSMHDIKWKMLQCKAVYNIYGTFVPGWFAGFFDLQLFGIGRLQFEVVRFGRTYQQDTVSLTPESKVIGVHIPGTGTKLDRESVKSAYKQAIAFFKRWFPEVLPVFVCDSWVLFHRTLELLSPQSNLYAFASDYDIISQKEETTYWGYFWVFDKHYRGNVDEMPQDTSLRRGYADCLRKGLKTGVGFGVYIYKEQEEKET